MSLDVYGLSFPVELNGGVWVWIFLPISGYLVGRGFAPSGYALTLSGFFRFLINRALRILPLAYVALAIGLAACIFSGENVPEYAIRQFLFVPPKNAMSLIGPLWTVATELQFYLMAIILVPLVYKALIGVLSGLLLFVGAVYLGLYWIEYSGDIAIQPRTFLGNITFFVFGLCLAKINVVKLYQARLYKLLIVTSLIILVWWLQNYKNTYFWGWGVHKGPLGGCMVIAMIIVATTLLITPAGDQNRVVFEKGLIGYLIKGLGWCGFYCYGIYVWHAVLGTLNRFFWQAPLGFANLGVLLLALPLAWLSYKWIEKPMLRFKMPHS